MKKDGIRTEVRGRNPVAKFAWRVNRAKVFKDKKKEAARRACRLSRDVGETIK